MATKTLTAYGAESTALMVRLDCIIERARLAIRAIEQVNTSGAENEVGFVLAHTEQLSAEVMDYLQAHGVV